MTGEQLKRMRQDLGLSQEELAEYLEVDLIDIVKWEREELAFGRFSRVLALAMDSLCTPAEEYLVAEIRRKLERRTIKFVSRPRPRRK